MALASALLAACVLASAFGLFGLSGARTEALAQLAEIRAARLAAYNLMQASIDAETGQRGYLLTNDRDFLRPYETGRAEAMRHLADLREVAASHAELDEDIDRAEALARVAFDELGAPLDRRLSPSALRAALETSKVSMDDLRRQVQLLLADIERVIEISRLQERRATGRIYWLGAALALLAMIAVALTALAFFSERKAWRDTFGALSAAREAAEEAREKAAASELAKTRFLAVASHDMRQPLHALSLYLSALDRRIENPEARGILAKMERATDSMIAMFSTLLDLARVQAGAVDPEITDFPLQDVFDRIAAENPSGKVHVSTTHVHLHSDSALIERALRNLVANALKHGGGEVWLTARIGNASRAEIVVADNGPGISKADQDKIFDEFVRLDARGEGLGLGLSIVRGIAAALEMPLEIDSDTGRGARFILRPRLAEQRADSAAPAAEPSGLNGALALVVDDEQLAREAIASALSDIGAQVRIAGDEAEANAVLDTGFLPRLLVMDLRIDGQLQGIDIARRIQARLSPPPHVIVITGDTAADTLELLQRSGFAWLIKPVSTRDLSHLAAEVAAQ